MAFAEANEGNVFATENILAAIMASPRSIRSFDILVTRKGDQVFLDKRNVFFDGLTVNETATDPPSEDAADNANSPSRLGLEATGINLNYRQQVLAVDAKMHSFAEPSPFTLEDDMTCADTGFRYRKFDLGEGITVVARTEVDAYATKTDGSTELMMVRALNEFDSKLYSNGINWRQKIDSQKGAVLATELKNNSFKVAKWVISAHLAGADVIKLGYVSRVKSNDPLKHVVLGQQRLKVADLATQVSLSMASGFGAIRHMAKLFLDQPEGKYLLLRSPDANQFQLYKVPDNAFANESTNDD